MGIKISRRKFIKGGLAAGAITAIGGLGVFNPRRAFPFAQSPTNIRKFVTTLPGLGPAGVNNFGQYIPLATKHTTKFAGKQTDRYNVLVTKYSQKMHPDLPGNTTFYGYTDRLQFDQKYLGGVIVVKRGTPVLLATTNSLPSKHILPVDPTLMAGPNGVMVKDLPLNRVATHLHGGFTPWFSDGTPLQWFASNGRHGVSFKNVPGTFSFPGTGTYYYPNDQSARMLWYHDHAIGITRLNAYAGIASAYIITDDFEAFLVNQGLLPDPVGIPLVIQDKSFVSSDIHEQDPTWKWGGPGSLWYPHDYEVDYFADGSANPKGRWDWGATVQYGDPQAPMAAGTMPLPRVSAVPEFFADTAMVNGAPYPVLNVTDKTYRFRMLNASQARFWHLNLYVEDQSNLGEVLMQNGSPVPGPSIYQIGTEGGFLPFVVEHKNVTPCPLDLVNDPSGNSAIADGPFNLLQAPAERSDILIDFTGMSGQSFILYGDAPGPFPMGDSRSDYFTGDADQTASGGAPPTQAGHGPNTRTIMKIVVSHGAVGLSLDQNWLNTMNTALGLNFAGGNPGVAPQQAPLLAPFNNGTGQFEVPAGTPILVKTLNEDFDEYGRLLQRGGTDQKFTNNQGLPTFGQGYLDSITETVGAGVVQAWDFYNNTGDTHPWHFHLVNVQIVGRGVFAVNTDGTPDFGTFTDLQGNAGKLTPPDPNEQGWKETVRMNPGEITRVIMRFDLPKLPKSMGNPLSRRTGGHEYVHHCHILEHEEHDMMRTLNVI